MKSRFCAKILAVGLLIATVAAAPSALSALRTGEADRSGLSVPAPAVTDGFALSDTSDTSSTSGTSGTTDLPNPPVPAASDLPTGAAPAPTPAPAPAPVDGDDGNTDTDAVRVITVEREDFASNAQPSAPTAAVAAELSGLKDYLREQLLQFNETIDLRQFHIPLSDIDALTEVFWHGIPDCFHVDGGFSYSYTSEKTISKMYVNYVLTPDEYAVRLAAVQASANRLLSGLRGNDELTDVEKALLIHDRLAVWCEYDLTAPAAHSMDGALVDGRAVCQGYALAYGYLLDQVGIENEYVSSKMLNHAWNLVYIDGVAYHADVTWDDPVRDITGRVRHIYFLCSTQGFAHNASDYTTVPSDTRYDKAYWRDSETAFQYLRGGLYYVDKDDMALYRRDDDQSKLIVSLPAKWYTSTSGYFPGCYARLANDGVNLLISQPDGVYVCDVLTGKLTVLWKPDLDTAQGFHVYGFAYLNGQLICDRYSSPNFTDTTKSDYQVRQDYTVEIPGDADGDGTVAPMDLDLLQDWLNVEDPEIDLSICDVDGDGILSMRDLVLLRQFLNGMPVTLQ